MRQTINEEALRKVLKRFLFIPERVTEREKQDGSEETDQL